MLWLLPLWLLLLTMLVGWGLCLIWVLRRLGGPRFGGVLTTFQTMWLGYAGLLGFLQLCSLILPIATAAVVISGIPAIAGFVLQRHAVTRRLAGLGGRRRVTIAIAIGVLVTWIVVAYAASDAVSLYDTGLYHLPVTKWAAAYPTVPGLANLHVRFGYNNSVFLFAAHVDTFWKGVAVHATNGFLLAAITAQWLIEVVGARGPRARVRQVFCLLTLPFLLARIWSNDVASLSTDLPLAILGLVVVLELVSLPVGTGRLFLPLTVAVSVAATAMSTKLGGLALFAVAGPVALVLVWRSGWRARVLLFALPGTIAFGWMSRGVILSGWLVFPLFGRIPLSWSVRPKVAAEHLRVIQSWSRAFGKWPNDPLFANGFWGWFPTWFERFKQTHEIALAGAGAMLLGWRAASGPSRAAVRPAGEWAAIAACVLGLAQWFLGAPEVRYGSYLFWMLPAAIFAPMIASTMRDANARALVVAGSLLLTAWNGGFSPRLDLAVPELFGRPPDAPVPPTEMVQIGSGAEVRIPTASDQCWDAELPCTSTGSFFGRRDLDSLGAGFVPTSRK